MQPALRGGRHLGQPVRGDRARLRPAACHPRPAEARTTRRPVVAVRDRGGPLARPWVALAQVRRVALDPDGQPLTPSADLTGSFSEMALYVLVRRDGTWWLNGKITSAASTA